MEAANGNVVIEWKQQKPCMVINLISDPAGFEPLHSQLVVLSTTASVQRGYQ